MLFSRLPEKKLRSAQRDRRFRDNQKTAETIIEYRVQRTRTGTLRINALLCALLCELLKLLAQLVPVSSSHTLPWLYQDTENKGLESATS